jgi:signal transduction histidine kinase
VDKPIDNAADVLSTGGKLTITAHNDGNDVVVEVSDDGPGIPDDVVPRIFDPFFTTKEPGKGTGLGMHTVHTIVTRIGGDISLRTGGDGTTFTVRIPTTPS